MDTPSVLPQPLPPVSAITAVDEALRKIVEKAFPSVPADSGQGPEPDSVQVSFKPPTREWSGKVAKPTVNLYLYDLREDLRHRAAGAMRVGPTKSVHPPPPRKEHEPPRFYTLSYMATAWIPSDDAPFSGAPDTHRLLSGLLLAFARRDTLEVRFSKDLEGLGATAELWTALQPDEKHTLSELWTALGNTLQPFIQLAVTLPLDTFTVQERAKPVEHVTLHGPVPDMSRTPAASPAPSSPSAGKRP
ncbi:DUF4255 domain-containing protein [Streptomyces yunnanensis]|uniref:Pvc16 N-terminal domain-containing protein n=1 Tax=Streptomyces yunnanensis TaxID=156453 RepID=A0A9X8N9K5_9ACTN|nr:DUF4255 domain-containing protein [Streptomyces yunnanensis]SHN34078.1 Protein of unknown function [Streptomyces yunnanensis]